MQVTNYILTESDSDESTQFFTIGENFTYFSAKTKESHDKHSKHPKHQLVAEAPQRTANASLTKSSALSQPNQAVETHEKQIKPRGRGRPPNKPRGRGRPRKHLSKTQAKRPPRNPSFAQKDDVDNSSCTETDESSDTLCAICNRRTPPGTSSQSDIKRLGCDECDEWYHEVCLKSKDLQRHAQDVAGIWKCPKCYSSC